MAKVEPARWENCDRAVSRRVRKEIETQIQKRATKEIAKDFESTGFRHRESTSLRNGRSREWW